MSNLNKFSRYLSALLRHQAIKHGYDIDLQGFVSVDQILKKCNDVTLQQIQEIVKSDTKQRFNLENRSGQWYIRAVQGHSIPNINPDLYLVQNSSEIPIVVHGTNFKAYELIKVSGLNRMGRLYIHFAHGTVTDNTVISGMRKSAKVMIYIDVPKAMAAGIKFYKSENGVILSDGINGIIDVVFFKKVEIIN